MATAALVGLAALRALRPLVSPEGDRTAMVGQRTRAALEREKLLTLRTIKELEFDRAMGKLSDADWQRDVGQAAGARGGPDAAARRRRRVTANRLRRTSRSGWERRSAQLALRVRGRRRARAERCVCSTTNDQDARFCKSCGQKL